MKILITGGAGFIGSHTCIELLTAGHDIIVVDNFSTSKRQALYQVNAITNKKFKVYQIDMLNALDLEKVFLENQLDAVIHFAGYKAVGESVTDPLKYYSNNLISTLNLCEMMQKYNVKNLVFSSSATVYGVPKTVPISEDFPLQTLNPYGRTKLMIEEILGDLSASDSTWSISLLRYFNPIGAHQSGNIGEDPTGVPTNLIPYITKVAIGELSEVQVFGNDYPTPDGTGVRDYIHVTDLARGHLMALEKVVQTTGIDAYNFGTGKGYSVLEMISTFEATSGVKIPYQFVNPRAGDAAICFADSSKARRELGWIAEKDITEMCEDSWRWQANHPHGYEEKVKEYAGLQSPHLLSNEDFFN
ncbi:UDP-glucose 4-epimerase GalE [Peribacillus psychrosaccharolyticus]|uniref:UDP-glucose 4-epimerase n=1 Tax=Peribacillus psychrosaccharolyticus TaxID=1407 RepID=A0A974NMT5_PERPY|nr:UDP-glucose 4-epimerase GalE [Peribacillus psychrosaccharolyticus]MEC2056063.1 UDP-glucose 4-epimerase GalE [Peribacillus psychrosaccharolyticus]MED3745504.1 UDP-glucose 4-epimerase GalE [Peribacillus psychrosaccharolyticus]QQT00740.1 UDP-glucose 4-epimerase GalE [Peribacillus psychrosaccharolyticus]